jgi:two-component system, LytTR family, response regulator
MGDDPYPNSAEPMKALIVDDEPPARRELRRLLADFPWIEIVGEGGHIAEAAAQIEALAPALLFLDIQMPGGSGFDLLTRLEHVPQVIFTTAHDEHAVRAFEVNALDYLLKPIDPARLAAALARVRNENAALAAAPRPDAPLQQLFLRDGSQCWFVPLGEVRLLTSEGNHVRLSWGTRRPLLGRPLSSIERRLDPKRFFRANRQQVLNLDFIESVEMGVNGRLHVQLRQGPEVEISRRQARLFRSQLSI